MPFIQPFGDDTEGSQLYLELCSGILVVSVARLEHHRRLRWNRQRSACHKGRYVMTAVHHSELLGIIKARFEKYSERHAGLVWSAIEKRLKDKPEKLRSLEAMERTGGEPDVIGFDEKSGEYLFCDCSAESPSGRRSLCYDREARQSRKNAAPGSSATGAMAESSSTTTVRSLTTLPEVLGGF